MDRSLPNFFKANKQKFYSGANGYFLLYDANSQRPANGD